MKTLLVLVLLVGGCVEAEDHPEESFLRRGEVPPPDDATEISGAGGAAGAWGPYTGSGGSTLTGAGGAGGAMVTGAGGAMVTGAGGATADPSLLNISCVSTRGCFGGQICYGGKCADINETVHPFTDVTCEQSADCYYFSPTYGGLPLCANATIVCTVDKHCACAP